MELYFDDGTNPTDEIVRTFLDVADRIIESGGAVAVHVCLFAFLVRSKLMILSVRQASDAQEPSSEPI